MTVLLLSDTGTRKALKNPEIAGRMRVGRGHYSVVFAKGADEVLRMTADPLTYYLHCDGCDMALQGEHFARVTEDHGDIGIQYDGNIPIYLFGTERLVKPTPGSAEKKLSTLIIKLANEYTTGYGNNTAHIRTLEKMSADKRLPASIQGALGELGCWAANYEHVALDFHAANIMMRPATGELIFNDPVHDRSLLMARETQLITGSRRRAA